MYYGQEAGQPILSEFTRAEEGPNGFEVMAGSDEPSEGKSLECTSQVGIGEGDRIEKKLQTSVCATQSWPTLSPLLLF